MSRRPRKTDRPGRYSTGFMAKLAKLADTVGIRPAARAEGVSTTTVRRAMQLAGVRAKPIGCPRIYNDEFARRVALHRARSGSTSATAKLFCVDHTTVKRFFRAFSQIQAIAA